MAKAAASFSFGTVAETKRSGAKKTVTALKQIAMKGLRDLKACRRLRAVILSVETKIETDTKLAMSQHFISVGCAAKIRPENFTGIDEGQEGNCQLRARSFGPYGIDEDVAADLAAAGLGEVIETSETYEFDSDLLADPAVREAVEKALSAKGIPAGIVRKRVKCTLRADAIDHLFKQHHGDPEFIEQHLPLLSTLAIRCDYNKADADLGGDVDRVAKLLATDELRDIVQKAAQEPEKVLSPPRKPSKRKAA